MYTFVKRTPPANLMTFDMAAREYAPQAVAHEHAAQALDKMNDPTYVEAARVLAAYDHRRRRRLRRG